MCAIFNIVGRSFSSKSTRGALAQRKTFLSSPSTTNLSWILVQYSSYTAAVMWSNAKDIAAGDLVILWLVMYQPRVKIYADISSRLVSLSSHWLSHLGRNIMAGMACIAILTSLGSLMDQRSFLETGKVISMF